MLDKVCKTIVKRGGKTGSLTDREQEILSEMAGKRVHFKAKTNFLQVGMAPISMHLSGNSFPFNKLFMVNVSRQ